jgi:outer membrane protein TolC
MIKNFIFFISFFSFPLIAVQEISPQYILELLDEKNYFIQSENLEITKYEALYLANKGNFDLRLDSQFTTVDKSSDYSEFSAKLKQPLPFLGIELWGGIRNNQGSLPSYWDDGATAENGEYALGLKLPLLSGFIIDKNRFALEQSFYQLQKSKIRYPQVYLEHYYQIVHKFMEWYVYYKKNEVYENLYNLAVDRQELIQKKNQNGALSKMDVVDNQSLVLIRKSALENNKLQVEMAKRNFELNFDHKKEIEIAQDAIPKLSFLKVDTQQNWIETALQNRGDLKAFEWIQKEKELNIKLQQQQRLPDLNLEAEYLTARSEDKSVFNNPSHDKKVALSFSYPLWQRKASGDIQKAKTELDLEVLKQNFLQEKIKNAMINLKQSILTLESRLVLANQEVENNYKLHKFEQRKMLEGLSSLIHVNIREQAIAESLFKKIQLEADLVKTQIELMVTAGTTPQFLN